MKSYIFASVALFCYTTAFLLVNRKLQFVTPVINVMIFSGTVFLGALVLAMFESANRGLVWPRGSTLAFAFGTAALVFVGQFCVFNAVFENRISVAVLIAFALTMPVLASFGNMLLGGSAPTRYHVVGYMVVLIGTAIVGYGEYTDQLNKASAEDGTEKAELILEPAP